MKKKHPICSTCNKRHPIHDDMFSWMDCWNYKIYEKNKKKSNTNSTDS